MTDPRAFRQRQQRVFRYLSENRIEAGVIVDVEGLRNQSLRYLCGQPGDALLFLFTRGESLLVPWDVPLARSLATADNLIPFEQYERSVFRCINTILQERRAGAVELSAALPYPLVQKLIGALPGAAVRCGPGGIDETINALRMIKDAGEIEALRRACGITDELIAAVPDFLTGEPKLSELELALFLEAEARGRGAEGSHLFPPKWSGGIRMQPLSLD